MQSATQAGGACVLQLEPTCSGMRCHLLTDTDLTSWFPGSVHAVRTFSAMSSSAVLPTTT